MAASKLGPFKLSLGALLRVEEHLGGVSAQARSTLNEAFPVPYNWGNQEEAWDISFEMLKGDLRVRACHPGTLCAPADRDMPR